MPIVSFDDEWEWPQYHSVKSLSMAISIEATEPMELFQWISLSNGAVRRRSNITIHPFL